MLGGLIQKNIVPFVVLPQRPNMSICAELDKKNIPYKVLKYLMPIYPPAKSVKEVVLFVPRLIQAFYYEYLAAKEVTAIARERSADIIHSNVGPLFIGYKAAKKLNIPHVWHLREYQDLDFKLNTWYSIADFIKKLHQPISHPIAISKGIYEHFNLGGDAKMIYNGIMRASDIRFIEEKGKHFLFVGSLSESKGIKNLLLAFAEFAQTRKDYKLHIAGNTNNTGYKQTLLSIIKEKGITNNVVFLGHRDDVYDLMSVATALIVPSVQEAFGRITAEAVFNGCLVIGNNAAGTKEILNLLGCGILYSGHDELLAALHTVAANGVESYYSEIKNAQQEVSRYFSHEQNVEAVYNYYEQILLKV